MHVHVRLICRAVLYSAVFLLHNTFKRSSTPPPISAVLLASLRTGGITSAELSPYRSKMKMAVVVVVMGCCNTALCCNTRTDAVSISLFSLVPPQCNLLNGERKEKSGVIMVMVITIVLG